MNSLKLWMTEATSAEKKRLAESVKINRNYLYQIASGNRKVSVDLAARIELATLRMSVKSNRRLPIVDRFDLCQTCRVCPHALRCGDES